MNSRLDKNGAENWYFYHHLPRGIDFKIVFSADLPESTLLHSLIFICTESLAVFRECLGDFSKQAMFFARPDYTLFWSFGAKIPAVA